MPVITRRRPPYFCQSTIRTAPRKCVAVLTDQDGKSCPACILAEAAQRAAEAEATRRFMDRPLELLAAPEPQAFAHVRRLWP